MSCLSEVICFDSVCPCLVFENNFSLESLWSSAAASLLDFLYLDVAEGTEQHVCVLTISNTTRFHWVSLAEVEQPHSLCPWCL